MTKRRKRSLMRSGRSKRRRTSRVAREQRAVLGPSGTFLVRLETTDIIALHWLERRGKVSEKQKQCPGYIVIF